MKKWIFYGSAVAGVLFFAFLVFWKSDRYPILTVNGAFVSARDYYANARGFERYQKISKDPMDSETVKRGILMSFVADAIVRAELDRRNLESVALRDVDAAINGAKRAELEKAASELYGWDIETFRRFALEPQARQLALADALQKEGKEFGAWLRGALQTASVSVYGLPYEWKGGTLVPRK